MVVSLTAFWFSSLQKKKKESLKSSTNITSPTNYTPPQLYEDGYPICGIWSWTVSSFSLLFGLFCFVLLTKTSTYIMFVKSETSKLDHQQWWTKSNYIDGNSLTKSDQMVEASLGLLWIPWDLSIEVGQGHQKKGRNHFRLQNTNCRNENWKATIHRRENKNVIHSICFYNNQLNFTHHIK